MISTQPFFISGLEDPEEAKRSAFGAFACFGVTFLLSVIGIGYDSYSTTKDVVESEGSPATDYVLAGGGDHVPNYGTSA